MRSVPAGSFERIASPEALWRAWCAVRRGKRRQPRMAAFEVEADAYVARLSRGLLEDRFRPGPVRLHVIRDPKVRLITALPIPDRIVQQATIAELGPCFERSFIEASYAWGRGRGPHRAVLRALAAMRGFRHRMCLDVRRYFPSMHHDTLLALLFRRVGDRRTRAVLEAFVRAGGEVYRSPLARRALELDRDPLPEGAGMPIGAYLSQWSGALYLDGLDHFVTRTLRVGAYQRFMDDLTLFGDDEAELLRARGRIAEWLRVERRMTLKRPEAPVSSTRAPFVYLGYRISRSGISASKKLRRRMPDRLRAAAEKGPEALERTLRSYEGLLMF